VVTGRNPAVSAGWFGASAWVDPEQSWRCEEGIGGMRTDPGSGAVFGVPRCRGSFGMPIQTMPPPTVTFRPPDFASCANSALTLSTRGPRATPAITAPTTARTGGEHDRDSAADTTRRDDRAYHLARMSARFPPHEQHPGRPPARAPTRRKHLIVTVTAFRFVL
jgi:hypothetical protein